VLFFYIDDLLCSAGEAYLWPTIGLAGVAAASFPAASRTQKERATDAVCRESAKRAPKIWFISIVYKMVFVFNILQGYNCGRFKTLS